MTTNERVEAAEARMNAAKDALLKYTERPETIDRDRYRRLVTQLARAQADFLKAVSELGQ